MQFQKYILNEESGANLTCYIQDRSLEMPASASRPAVIVMPGGGYCYLSDREADPLAIAFLSMGYHAFILNYSVGMHGLWPVPLREAEEAMDILYQHSDEWYLDTSKIAVAGCSAGGHLASALGSMGKKRPAAMILLYPGIDPSVMKAGFTETDVVLEGKEYASYPHIASDIDDQTIPAFIALASADHIVDYGIITEFTQQLKKHEVPFELHYFGFGGHGFSVSNSMTASEVEMLYDPEYKGQWVPVCHQWLIRLWGDFEHSRNPEEHRMVSVTNYTGKKFSLDDSIEVLLRNESCVNVLKEVFPEIDNFPEKSRKVSVLFAVRFWNYGDVGDFSRLVRLEEKLRMLPCKNKSFQQK